MNITDEQFKQANVVIDAGILAAEMCHRAGFSEQNTVDMLREGLLDETKGDATLDTTSPRVLADLLTTCIIRLASQNRDLDELGVKVRGVLDLAKKKGVVADD